MGNINVVQQNGATTAITASGYPNNAAAAAYIKANPALADTIASGGFLDVNQRDALAAAGNTPLPTMTSAATIGGVPVPAQTAAANPEVSVIVPTAVAAPPPVTEPGLSNPNSSTNYSVLDGGTDQTSLMNQGLTPLPEVQAANNGALMASTATVFPAAGYVPPPSLIAPNTLLADWYRNGNADLAFDEAESIKPRMIGDFDEEISTIYIYGPSTKTASGASVDTQIVPPYSKFILESVQEAHAERSQIVETFGDFYVFLFGERPPMYNFSGTLINTATVNWVSDFKYYYDNYLRGTKCVESGARLVITYGGRQIEGFMLAMQTATDASVERGVKLSFSVVVTRKSFIAFSDDFGFVTTGGVTVGNTKMIQLLNQIAGAEGIGTSSTAQSAAFNAVSSTMAGGSPPITTVGG